MDCNGIEEAGDNSVAVERTDVTILRSKWSQKWSSCLESTGASFEVPSEVRGSLLIRTDN